MAFNNSRIFREWLSAALEPREGFNGAWNGAAANRAPFKAALFDDFPTGGDPDETADAEDTAYGGGVWLPAREQSSPPIPPPPPPTNVSHWPPRGLDITGTGADGGFSSTGILIVFDGDDTGTGNDLVTLANVHGDLVYDTEPPDDDQDPGTPQDVGACFHSYSGEQRVTGGTFTIVWSPDGIMRVGVGLPGGGP